MKRILVASLFLAGCISASNPGHQDGGDDLLSVGVDLSGTDAPPSPGPDLAQGGDMGTNGPVVLTGDFHAGSVDGTANGIALRLRFNWSAAISGTANGITLNGSFR